MHTKQLQTRGDAAQTELADCMTQIQRRNSRTKGSEPRDVQSGKKNDQEF